jgi:hypothetical protein
VTRITIIQSAPHILIMLAAFLAEPVQAAGAASVRWSANLYGRSTDDSLSSSKTVGAAFGLDIEKHLSEDFFTHFRGGLALETGSSSALFTDEFRPDSKLGLSDARLRWKVYGPVSLTVGALDQQHLSSPLLVSSGTFPAALASLRFAPGAWYVEGIGQAAIPSGSGFTTKNTGKEATPLLYSQTALLGWRRNADYFGELRATHFDFRNLTRGMAQDSRFYGNTVTGISTSSSFVYRYEGYELGASGSLPLASKFALVGGGSFVRNSGAPASINTGRYAYAGFSLIGPGFRLRPVGEWYENEEDSAPAFYSSSEFGHNNRRGIGGSLKLFLAKPNIEIELKARKSDLIRPQAFQRNNFRYYLLSIGLPYASF